MGTISRFEEIHAWQEARELVIEVFKTSNSALEVQSILYVALDLEYIQKEEINKLYNLANECVSVIAGFSSYLRKI